MNEKEKSFYEKDFSFFMRYQHFDFNLFLIKIDEPKIYFKTIQINDACSLIAQIKV